MPRFRSRPTMSLPTVSTLRRAARLAALLALTATALTGCRGCVENSRLSTLVGAPGAAGGVDPMGAGMGVESSVLPEPLRGETGREIADLRPVYFEFDSADMLEPAKRVLDRGAGWLKANPGVPVQVEGHCDERGTADYNLALGQRRADTVRAYLSGVGVAPGRVRTISYAGERPANPAHDESAWAANRRAVFKVYAAR